MAGLAEETTRLFDAVLNDMEDIDAKLHVLAVNLERLGGEKVQAVSTFHSQWQTFVRAVHLAATVGADMPSTTPADPRQQSQQQQQESEGHGEAEQREDNASGQPRQGQAATAATSKSTSAT